MTHLSGLDINRLERITDHLQRQYIMQRRRGLLHAHSMTCAQCITY